MTDSERLRRLLNDALILDMTGANAPVHPVLNQPCHFESWIGEYKKANVSWVSLTAGSDHIHSAGEILRSLSANRRYLLTHSDEYVFVEKVSDVRRAKALGKLAVNFNFQGSNPLQGDINLVEPLFKLGVGHMLLCYNDKNLAGGGCHEKDDPALSRYGKQLVEEMNRVGMVVDATHTAHRTTMGIFDCSHRPVIFSHSNANGVFRHERNIDDDQIKACASSGGVVGVNGVAMFLSSDPRDCSGAALFRHIDYIAELVGHEHVGLGLDFVPELLRAEDVRKFSEQLAAAYGADQYPIVDRFSTASPAVILELTREMIDHGYRDEHILAILGLNWARVFEQHWDQ